MGGSVDRDLKGAEAIAGTATLCLFWKWSREMLWLAFQSWATLLYVIITAKLPIFSPQTVVNNKSVGRPKNKFGLDYSVISLEWQWISFRLLTRCCKFNISENE